MMRRIHDEEVYGCEIDPKTRCAHYHSELDIIAIRFYCCQRWFPCFECHAASADHPTQVWPGDQNNALAILCGACGYQLPITEYFDCGSICPKCVSSFNPGCALKKRTEDQIILTLIQVSTNRQPVCGRES